ncbi:MAG: AAA family ATPase [Myxococcales bacterium]|nr:AAA family ATPase [Myxococcota bacterium]MDW8283978.1 AAA family ATPase [Myxococcales bacterium]
MRFTKLLLTNWRNFRHVEVDLKERVFLVGPNASGKSNLLDAFRFLRDIAEPHGGFQKAVADRGGVSRLRSLHARRHSEVVVDVCIEHEGQAWRYRLAFVQDNVRRPVVKEEQVWRGNNLLLDRPDDADRKDAGRLSQTHLEQVTANLAFRDMAHGLSSVRYLHLVPQLIRDPERYVHKHAGHDPFGGDFLEQLARAQREQRRTFESRMQRINQALQVAVPRLQELRLERDETGRPHLRALYGHWRPQAGWQSEAELSDGTLRLLGLLWSVLDGSGPLLLEEPELSLHEAVVRHLPAMIGRATRKSRRQVLLSTHAAALLSDGSIGADEVLLLRPTEEDTEVVTASNVEAVRALLADGVPMGEAVLPQVAPAGPEQLLLRFGV